jgi:hypothetical protein
MKERSNKMNSNIENEKELNYLKVKIKTEHSMRDDQFEDLLDHLDNSASEWQDFIIENIEEGKRESIE